MRDICLSWRIQQNHIRDHGTMRVISDLPLESLNLAHGDLRSENILFHRNHLKLPDFDSTSEIGSVFEARIALYGRLLGSLFYLINYGFEVYVYPELIVEAAIDSIIIECWHGEYKTVAELTADMECLLCPGSIDRNEIEDTPISPEDLPSHKEVFEAFVACGLPKTLDNWGNK
ncbi:conserved hypothetical protein [Microsporum canis CBS 113480]|uniref:Protein kinase domain-containing protein n=1 Tax=Arthroderma otae (strain ATCC MYA-4605 / CBS 113480) TaxID=554155 RepID=C5FJZ9_ARTOC|nr:conserved hypothetical protein [Microsporum canis CBS 113480]EEQ30021.1 conserved hypothetical protein [Microsporum canis CBS 113480]